MPHRRGGSLSWIGGSGETRKLRSLRLVAWREHACGEVKQYVKWQAVLQLGTSDYNERHAVGFSQV